MKKLSKISLLILSIALIFACVALAISADGGNGNVASVAGTEYATLKEALNSASSGATVTLVADADIANYTLSKSVTIDLNGHTLSSSEDMAFGLNNGGKLNIIGDGNIDLAGRLVYSGSQDVALNVKGDMAGININHKGTKNKNLVYTRGGSWTFTNVNIKSNHGTSYTFYTDNGYASEYVLKAVTIDTTEAEGVNQSASVVRMSYKSKIYLDHCTVKGNAGFIYFQNDTTAYDSSSKLITTEKTVEDYVVIKNSYISCINTVVKNYIFGSYTIINGDIKVENSYLESSYRALMLKDTGNGELILDNSYFVVDNCNNQESTSYFARSGYIRVKSGSALVADRSTVNSKTPSGSNAGFIGFASNAPAMIYLEEGARLNYEAFTKLTTLTASGSYYVASNENYIRFVEIDDNGNETYVKPSASKKFTFTYDPLGDPTAPYVVTKISESAPAIFKTDASGNITASTIGAVADCAALSEYNYFYHDGGTRTGQFNQYEEIKNADGTTTKKYIDHGTKYINGNPAYYYAPNGYIAKSSSGVDTAINFWLGLSSGVIETSFDLFIFEFDIATSSSDGFAPGNVSLNSRTVAGTGGSGTSKNFFSIANDGKVTSTFLSNFTPYQLKTNGWNKVSVIVETSTANGRAHVFIDGNYLGYGQAYSQEGAYISAPRFDSAVKSRDVIGPVTLFDNVSIRILGNGSGAMKVSGETDSRQYITNGGKPMNTGNTIAHELGAITVGGIEYPDIDSAASAAKALGTIAQLNKDITVPVTVTSSCRISANGHTISVAQDSLPYVAETDELGNITAYVFSAGFNSKLTYHWYVGDILTGEYTTVTSEYRAGGIPSYAFNAEKIVYSASERAIYRQTGWIGVEANTPLTPEYIDEVMASETAGNVYAMPKVEKFDIAQAIVDSNGNLVSATDSTVIANGSLLYKLAADQTFKLHGDCTIAQDASASSITYKNGTFNIDLCGNALTIDKFDFSFIISTNATLNVYSGTEGGAIYKNGKADNNTVRGNALFHMAPVNDANAKIEANVTGSTHNSTLNIGTIAAIPGAIGTNLTITGDCVIEPRSGDESCSVNIDGATLVRVGAAYGALIYPRFYNGSISIKNSVLINTSNGYIISTPASYVSAVGFDYSTTATIEGCSFINYSNDAASIGATTCFDSITVKDSAFRGYILEDSIDIELSKITLGENVATTVKPRTYNENDYAKLGLDFKTEEIEKIFDGKNYFKTVKLTASSNKLTSQDLYIAIKGNTSGIPSGAKSFILEPLQYVTSLGNETVKVTWCDLDGNTLATEAYVKGGNVFGIGLSVPDSSIGLFATKKVFTSWGTLPKNLQADATVTPEYKLCDTVSGIKYNLSLYADFVINLFIPVEYKDYVKVYANEARSTELDQTIVTVSGKEYVRVGLDRLAKSASDAVEFYLTVEENVDGMQTKVYRTVSRSITEYAETVLSDTADKFTAEDKVLIYYMLDYANEAAKYFGGEGDDKVIAPMLDKYSRIALMYTAKEEKTPKNEGLTAVFEEASIRLTSSPAFVLYLKEGFIGNVTVSYAGGIETRVFDTFSENASTKENNALVIRGMKVYNFGTTLNITAEGTVNGEPVSVNGSFNLEAYAEYARENALDHLDLVNALSLYAEISEKYKLGKLGDSITDFGNLIITAPETIYTNYNGKPLDIVFTNPEFESEITYEISDARVTVEDGKIAAKGTFSGTVEVSVIATTEYHRAEFKLNVTTFSANRVENVCKQYEAEGGILSTAKQGGTVFVGDSYFTLGYWKDFYTDFADEDAYLLGIAGSIVDEWFVCSERLLYPLNPTEIIVHIGFNDIYGSAAYLTPEEIGAKIVELLTIYHEVCPDADIYYCSVESSKWANNYDKSFNDAVIVNTIVSAYADECEWLTFVNTRYIFCDDEEKVVYTDGDGNSNDDDDTGIYGQGSHPSVIAYDEYKKAIDSARDKNTDN